MPNPSELPPFKGGSPKALTCCRSFADGTHCPLDATWHVIWTEKIDNGIVCDAHMEEIVYSWRFYAAHPYNPICSISGAMFSHEENRCSADVDQLEMFHATA